MREIHREFNSGFPFLDGLLAGGLIHHSVTVFDGGTRLNDICAKFLEGGDLMEIVEQMRHITRCNLPFCRRRGPWVCRVCTDVRKADGMGDFLEIVCVCCSGKWLCSFPSSPCSLFEERETKCMSLLIVEWTSNICLKVRTLGAV